VIGLVHWDSEETIDDLDSIVGGNQWWGVDCGRRFPQVDDPNIEPQLPEPSGSFRAAVSLSLVVVDDVCRFILNTAGVGNHPYQSDNLFASSPLQNCLGTNTANQFTPFPSNSNFSNDMGWYVNGAASWSPEV
jgi:hypothetical protein